MKTFRIYIEKQLLAYGDKTYLKVTPVLSTLDYQINVAYEINVALGISLKINKRSLWNKHSLVIIQ